MVRAESRTPALDEVSMQISGYQDKQSHYICATLSTVSPCRTKYNFISEGRVSLTRDGVVMGNGEWRRSEGELTGVKKWNAEVRNKGARVAARSVPPAALLQIRQLRHLK